MSKLRREKSHERKLKEIEDAWLGLDEVDEDTIFNPMSILDFNSPDYHHKLSWIMSKPEYFSFICKHILNITILPSQALMLCEMWNRKFPMLIASRGFGKSFTLALYSILRALLLPKRKVVVVGAAFRQSKVLFEYMETIWNNAPILRDICDQNSGPRRDIDRCVLRINESRVTCLPLGDGTKIRGQRAHDIISDEFASIPREIFETVVAGFAAVTSDVVGNVQKEAAIAKAAELGMEFERVGDNDVMENKANQIILSGTAYYDFNHFAAYWKKWRSIVKSKGDKNRLREIFGGEDVPDDFDWTEYSVIRIPYELLPKGFMDASQVARSKATVHAGIYQMEFGACFTRDSQGFFKRSMIETCVCNAVNNIRDVKGNVITFEAQLVGNPKRKYVFGIDPASEVDNFSIVVVEMADEHRRIVHCWTTTRHEHREKLKQGQVKDNDFYSYCARKIRTLMKLFPCERIACDAQGGGIAIMESLHDKNALEPGELPIWPVVDPDDEKDTDDEQGLHILEMCQFGRQEWLGEANHGMRKDFEDKILLFPQFDAITLAITGMDDNIKGRTYDTLENCVMEIEELKDELAMIQMTQTPAGRDKWDTPEVIIGTGKKTRQRKDRYSALLMANMAARILMKTAAPVEYESYGGWAAITSEDEKQKRGGLDSTGPAWWMNGETDIY